MKFGQRVHRSEMCDRRLMLVELIDERECVVREVSRGVFSPTLCVCVFRVNCNISSRFYYLS